ncbi:CAP domain-containing protein [Antarctobacter jejuensis]|uniref:CAP domain-containing protein n=1 Tax=Antarctobacter jejuensis TaxID=1439938 RepID=UPI003FD4252D
MMRLVSLVALCALLASCGGWRSQDRGGWQPFPRSQISRAEVSPVAGPAAPLSAASARQALNAFRAENGLGPLTTNPQLESAALAHARDMARRGIFDHRGSDGSDPMVRVQRAGYSPCYVSENIARGQRSLSEVMAGWANSPGHRRNMLSAGAAEFALVRGAGDNWVMVLGRGC